MTTKTLINPSSNLSECWESAATYCPSCGQKAVWALDPDEPMSRQKHICAGCGSAFVQSAAIENDPADEVMAARLAAVRA